MDFRNMLYQRQLTPTAVANPVMVPPPIPPAPTAQAPQQPPMITNIANTVDAYMPALEQITGLTRREIFLHLLKTGLKGGSVESLVNGLIGGQAPQTDAKFVRYVKTLAVWVPVSILLLGLSVVSVVVFAKFLFSLV
jgi:hypothetical protein